MAVHDYLLTTCKYTCRNKNYNGEMMNLDLLLKFAQFTFIQRMNSNTRKGISTK